MTETFVFTPIPHGAHNSLDPQDGMLRCSVHVGVRLTPAAEPATPADFANFADWPARIPSFAIQLGDGTILQAKLTSAPASSSTWSAIFGQNLPVRAYRGGAALPPASSDRWFDAGAVAGQVQTRYAAAGQAAIAPHPAWRLQPAPIRLAPGFQTQQAVFNPVLQAARAYFETPATVSQAGPPPTTPPPPDAHDLIAYLHQTPAMLRALGLILEIEAPWHGGAPPGAPTTLKLLPTFPGGVAAPPFIAPTVAYSLAACQFENGFEPVASTPGASGLQLFAFDPMRAAHVYSRYISGPLPALRGSGLSLMRRPMNGGSAAMALIRGRAARTAALAAAPDTPIQAADLVAGHRIDVWDGAQWRSLCKVEGTASRGGVSIPVDAEGIVSSSVVLDADGAARANDTLAYWNGWSLCAPRPTFKTNPPPTPGPSPLGLSVTRSVTPASLPALRYGKSYRFRARLVDVAGNSLPPPASLQRVPNIPGPAIEDFTGATEPETFLRLEPIGSPAMAFAAPPGLGESSTQIVVRTSAPPATSPPLGVHVATGPGIDKRPPPDTRLRYLLPPQGSVELAEKHGMFDTAAGAPDPNAYARIQQTLEGAGSLWNPAQPQPSTAFPTKAAVFAGQSFPEGLPAVPYLPDPACGGATLIAFNNGAAIGMENGAAASLSFAAAGVYPQNAQPGTLQVVAGAPGAAGSAVANGAHGLVITLPPGERVTLGLASTVAPAMTPMLGVAKWAHDSLPALAQRAYMANVAAGLVGAATPQRQISLIHAVQQPLAAPAITGAAVQWAQSGDLSATITARVTAEVKTTANVTIEASWTEWVDAGPGSAPPAAKAMTAHIATLVVDPAAPTPVPALNARYMFGDTRRRDLTLNAIAASAFAEFFPPGTDCTLRSSQGTAIIRLANQAPAKPRLAYAIPSFKWTRSAPGVSPYVSTRQGNALRLWLERPWYTSGSYEVLAVIVGDGPLQSQSQPSQWGADPLSASQAPNGPTICDFLAQTDSNFAGTATAVLPDSGETVALRLYRVEYDPVTDRYFCDVAFDASKFGGAYRPFVQLEIAAYQPMAADPSFNLSATVTVPFTQVFADRTLTVTVSPADAQSWPTVDIAMQGIGPEQDSPSFTSELGRGLSTQVDAHLVFTGVVGPKTLPPEPGEGQTSTASGSTKLAHQVTLANGKTVSVPNPPAIGGDGVNWPSTVGLDLGSVTADFSAGLADGVNWEAVDITVYEFEMLSPGPQLVGPTGVDPNGKQKYELTGSGSGLRPWRMIYAESLTLQSGFIPPVAPLLPLHGGSK